MVMKLLTGLIAPAFCIALVSPAFALCPDPTLDSATDSSLLTPQSSDVRAQGDHIMPCADWALAGVTGYLQLASTAVFDLAGMAPHILTVEARAECDPVLAVRSGDGQWFFGE